MSFNPLRDPFRKTPLFDRARSSLPTSLPAYLLGGKFGAVWGILSVVGRGIKKAFARTCMALGGLVFLSIFISLISFSFFSSGAPDPLPDKAVMFLEIDGDFVQRKEEPSLLNPFPIDRPSLWDVTQAIDHAANDDRIKEMVLYFKSATGNLADIQELRRAILDFRAHGKKVTAFAHSFGELGNGTANYYLAAAADEIWMQPIGVVEVSGLSAELPYAKDALAKIGVRAEFSQRKEYKSAASPVTQNAIDPASQEMTQALLRRIGDDLVQDIAADRGLPPQTFREVMDIGLLLDREALDSGLIDRLDYDDTLFGEIRDRIYPDPELSSAEPSSTELSKSEHHRQDRSVTYIDPEDYLAYRQYEIDQENPRRQQHANVAIIHVEGAIISHVQSAHASSDFSNYAAADEISQAIFDASDMDEIEAIILRINSPGGSAVASEAIRRAVAVAQDRGKKVIASMGSVAASGGYWIVPEADLILASPASLTGSIGVVGGKFVLDGFWQKIGVNWAKISYGKHAGMWSPNQGFSPSERQRFEAMLDDIYDQFITKVSAGRGLTPQETEEIARGRVWTGGQALENKLIDQIGGFSRAQDETAKLLGYENRHDLTLITLPAEKTFQEQLVELLDSQASVGHILSRLGSYLSYHIVGEIKREIQFRISGHAPRFHTLYTPYNANILKQGT